MKPADLVGQIGRHSEFGEEIRRWSIIDHQWFLIEKFDQPGRKLRNDHIQNLVEPMAVFGIHRCSIMARRPRPVPEDSRPPAVGPRTPGRVRSSEVIADR